jgi:aryl-phospho-beta-D-glucosidase BglC (GH1 family)
MHIPNNFKVSAGLVLLAVFFVIPLTAQVEDPAWKRAEHLRHGINASMWFAQSPADYSVERLRSFTTADDIALMRQLGFDHVRLSIDPVPLAALQHSENAPFVAELDRVVGLMLQQHLAVIIDIHPESNFKAPMLTANEPVERLAQLWTALAKHFAAQDPEHIFFEIMNEPEQSDPYRWIGVEARLADAIRTAAPQNTILASGAHWSGLADLLQTYPLAMSNVIYTFHDYSPFPFTHQGATWSDPGVQPLRDMPYPSTPDAVQANLGQPGSLRGQLSVEEYGLDRWNAERVERTIEFAGQWSAMHRVPVYCGEFGVLRQYADPAMRAAWLHDMTTAMEKHHIGWAMWDYQGSFGLVHKENGKPVADPLIVKALGLQGKF